MKPASRKHERPRIALRPEPRVDGIRVLRGAFRVLKRRFGLRAVTVRERTMHRMISVSDTQLTVMATAANVSPDRRAVFLERVGAMLRMRHRFNDLDVDEVSKLALCGLVHQHTDAA